MARWINPKAEEGRLQHQRFFLQSSGFEFPVQRIVKKLPKFWHLSFEFSSNPTYNRLYSSFSNRSLISSRI